jgi:biotin carboxylase
MRFLIQDREVSCYWRLPNWPKDTCISVHTLDLVVHSEASATRLNLPSSWHRLTLEATYLPTAITTKLAIRGLSDSATAVFKVILPQITGYWTRTNIIQQRFIDSSAKSVVDIAQARQLYEPAVVGKICASSLSSLLDSAVGIVELQVSANTSLDRIDEELTTVESEVLNRLSLPLLLQTPIPRYRLAIIHGYFDFKMTEMLYRAAADMDIEVYILAEPDHWFQENKYDEFRKEYIPLDIQRVDDTLVERIINAFQERDIEIDGIAALTDRWLIPAAQVAQILGLPTEAPRVFEICRDKYLTRQLDLPSNFMSECVEGLKGASAWLEDLHQAEKTLIYPLIVKPCAGWASEGVRKVYNEDELLRAVSNANLNDYSRAKQVTIETYIDGPEFDANFILWNGKPLFVDISDQFPAEADIDTNSSTKNFLETELFLPSALPSSEQEGMLDVLRKLGCQNGIHHMEGRLRNSAMEYIVTEGSIDLAWKPERTVTAPESVLIENNPRPPGTNSNSVILHTYGIEFYAVHLLIALGDAARVRALSVPFTNGAQYHCDLVSIPVVKGGFFASRDATGDFFERLPALKSLVVKSGSYFSYGDKIPDPSSGVWTQVAYFMIASRTSRREVVETAQTIRAEFRYKLVARYEDLSH